MTKTLADLQALCAQLGIIVPPSRRPAKEPYVLALREHLWMREHPNEPLPDQIEPMLLGDWTDLGDDEAEVVARDDSGWCMQEKKDGVRALLHVTPDGVRITGRAVTDTTFRLGEFQSNVPHLTMGHDDLAGTVLDGELVSPVTEVDTGETTTAAALQAVAAILAAAPDKALAIQNQNGSHLRFQAFDILRFRGTELTHRPLADRLAALEVAYLSCTNPHLDLVPTHMANKGAIHERLIAEGKEGSVWKRLDQPYQPGKRVRHWLKRKRGLEVEAVVTGFKPGSADRGNAELIGALEFSVSEVDGSTSPIAWVSCWTGEERRRMTRQEPGAVALAPIYLGRRAVIGGQDVARKSGRIRHAKLVRWIEATTDRRRSPIDPGGEGRVEVGLCEPELDGITGLVPC